jgi:regulator of RNase E activity RraA
MNAAELTELRDKFIKMSTTVVSDALDAVGLRNNVAIGVKPVWNCPPIVGTAVTVRNIPTGTRKQVHHGGFVTASHCEDGSVIVVGNSGDIENNGWGELVSWAAKAKGAVGTVVDGAARDVGGYEDMGYPVYAKGVVPRTARGRLVQDAVNITIRFCGVQVNPGDLVFADRNGIVFIPVGREREVLEAAEKIYEKEEAMIEAIKAGKDPLKVDLEHDYEKMLKKD